MQVFFSLGGQVKEEEEVMLDRNHLANFLGWLVCGLLH